MTVKIYHNPRCSKSRDTLALIREANIKPQIIEYLETPLKKSTLKTLIKEMGIETRGIMRQKEAFYRDLDLKNPDKTNDELLDAIVENPILLERPIVITSKGTKICRPPELVKDIL